MEIHLKTLGRLNILYALLTGSLAAAALIITGGIFELYAQFDDPMMGAVLTFLALLHIATAFPTLIGGIFILRYHSWSRVLLIIMSALNALSIPLGTFVGLYGLWVLLTPEVEPLFRDGPPEPYSHRKTPPPGNRLMRGEAE